MGEKKRLLHKELIPFHKSNDQELALLERISNKASWTRSIQQPRIVEAFVSCRRGAIVREQKDMDSRLICRLVYGTKVLCTEMYEKTLDSKRISRRQIVAPLNGWLSAKCLRFGPVPKVAFENVSNENSVVDALHRVVEVLRDRRENVFDEMKSTENKTKTVQKRYSHSEKSKYGLAQLTSENFEAQTRASYGDGGDWFVAFTTEWCKYSQALKPIWEKLAADHSHADFRFGKVDLEHSPELAFRFGIQAFPTIALFHHGSLFEYNGTRTREALEQFALGGFRHSNTRVSAVPPPLSANRQGWNHLSSHMKNYRMNSLPSPSASSRSSPLADSVRGYCYDIPIYPIAPPTSTFATSTKNSYKNVATSLADY